MQEVVSAARVSDAGLGLRRRVGIIRGGFVSNRPKE